MIDRFILLLIGSLLLIQMTASGQNSRSELEKKRASILQSIKETEDLLNETKKDKKATLSQLKAIQAKLHAREQLIKNINQELINVEKNIGQSASEVLRLKENLNEQKSRYAQSLRFAYSNRTAYNALVFVFSASNFNEALRRLKYMKRFREFRKNQSLAIKTTQHKIEENINSLTQVKVQKSNLLGTEQSQKEVIQKEQDEKNKIIQELKGKEKELALEIENKKAISKKINNAIAVAIKKEIEIARKKAEEEKARQLAEQKRLAAIEEQKKQAALAATKAAEEANKNKVIYGSGPNQVTLAGTPPPSSNTESEKPKLTSNTPPKTNTIPPPIKKPVFIGNQTPESQILSDGFVANKGKLPWPVSSGMIVDHFGKHRHAVATSVEIENAGIDIQTPANGAARAVYNGQVSSVIDMGGSGKVVIIKHGEYFSVYSGLKQVNVSKDQQVSTKQTIGVVGTNDDGATILNFQIWKGANKNNPSTWIAPM